MSSMIEELKAELAKKEEEIDRLKSLLNEFKVLLFKEKERNQFKLIKLPEDDNDKRPNKKALVERLSNEDIARYSRQLILPELGVRGQIRLKNSSVLIVGAGGLGCPAAIYLAAAGIGKLGVIDYDEVELSNLHRQILHGVDDQGVPKSLSVAQSCARINPGVEYVPYLLQLNSGNALQIISKYDIVIDATDNVATRYLLNDACVLANKPLVSGSALRFEGQLTVYNHQGGPCYRCLFPQPPPPETVTNCSDGGVLGAVPGVIGTLQALEALKLAAGLESSYSQRLLLFDGLDGTIRTIKLRPKSASCSVCGDQPTIKELIDYEQFCGSSATDKNPDLHVLNDSSRITAQEYCSMIEEQVPHVLVDVRQPVELEICQLPHPAINIPYPSFNKSASVATQIREAVQKELGRSGGEEHQEPVHRIPVVCVCRRGNDSQLAVEKIQEQFRADGVRVVDIIGGLYSWTKKVDPTFPVY